MILKRIISDIRSENWVTSIVELMVVVLGIYIGLQADAWNDARKDREREKEYIYRLEAELNRDMEGLSRAIARTSERDQMGALIEASLKSGDIGTTSPLEFVQAVDQIGYFNPKFASGFVFDEMKSGGDLGLLQDEELKVALADYYDRSDSYKIWMPNVQDAMLTYFELTAGVLSSDQQLLFDVYDVGVLPDITHEDAIEVLARLKARPDAVDWIPRTRHYQQLQLRMSQDLYTRAEYALQLVEFNME